MIQREKGYAFIEVVFLSAVIAILSAVAIPKISNELQVARADYLMKSLYSELRFMQAAKRITSFKEENILKVNKKTQSLVIISSNVDERYRIRFKDDEELRRYNLPSRLYFKENFSITMTNDGILSNARSTNRTAGSIILTDDSKKTYKPFIVYNSVGRIRFSNDGYSKEDH